MVGGDREAEERQRLPRRKRMKVPPPPALQLPFSPAEVLWRYPLLLPTPGTPTPSTPSATAAHSPLLDLRSQMPQHIAADPRLWSREDVVTFLNWFQAEFDLPSIDVEKFCMNGKALSLLTKGDVAGRAPGAGDILHNALQLLLHTAPWRIPASPLLPLAGPPPSPHSHIQWATGGEHPPVTTNSVNGHHYLQPSNSVTLSPAPSTDSQSGSPKHHETNHVTVHVSSTPSSISAYQNGGHSDSEDSMQDSNSPSPMEQKCSLYSIRSPARSPSGREREEAGSGRSGQAPSSPMTESAPSTPTGSDTIESGSGGRLLWDFLQQLLNDPGQKYSHLIAWKNRETGVFKIMDPAGLARLWGIQKNHLSMNYDKMSRALRYYYRVNILKKVQGERHCYQFLRNPSELKGIKNISLLRHAPPPVAAYMDEGPTDLSLPSAERNVSRTAESDSLTPKLNGNHGYHFLFGNVKFEGDAPDKVVKEEG